MKTYFLPCSMEYEKVVHTMTYYSARGTFSESDVFVTVTRDYVDQAMIDALLKNEDPPKTSLGGNIISTLIFVSKTPALNCDINSIEALCEFIVHRYSYLNPDKVKEHNILFKIPETYLKLIDNNGLLKEMKVKAGDKITGISDVNTAIDFESAVKPAHYKDHFVKGDLSMQWVEALQYESRYRNPEVFKGALLMQADKYLSRLGGKDNEVQEIMKAIWYLRFLAAYTANGDKPITISEIPKLLGEV